MRRDGSYIKQSYPDNTFYLVKRLIDEMNEQQITARDLCRKVGVSDPSIITKWKYNRRPSLDILRACFNVLGYDLSVKRIKDEASTTRSFHSSKWI